MKSFQHSTITCSVCKEQFSCFLYDKEATGFNKCARCFIEGDTWWNKDNLDMVAAFYLLPPFRLLRLESCMGLGHTPANNSRECLDCDLRGLQNADGKWASGVYTRSVSDMAAAHGISYYEVKDRLKELSDGTCDVLTGR